MPSSAQFLAGLLRRAHGNQEMIGRTPARYTPKIEAMIEKKHHVRRFRHVHLQNLLEVLPWSCTVWVPNPSPTLDKNLASMGPGILSSIGVGVWRKAPEAFPDSNTIACRWKLSPEVFLRIVYANKYA